MADIKVKVWYSISEVLKFKIAQIKFQKIMFMLRLYHGFAVHIPTMKPWYSWLVP